MFTNEYIKTILQLLEVRCPNKKKVIYSNKYYLNRIILVLKDAVSWKSLSRLFPEVVIKSKNIHSILTFKMSNNRSDCINRDYNATLNMKKNNKTLTKT